MAKKSKKTVMVHSPELGSSIVITIIIVYQITYINFACWDFVHWRRLPHLAGNQWLFASNLLFSRSIVLPDELLHILQVGFSCQYGVLPFFLVVGIFIFAPWVVDPGVRVFIIVLKCRILNNIFLNRVIGLPGRPYFL